MPKGGNNKDKDKKSAANSTGVTEAIHPGNSGLSKGTSGDDQITITPSDTDTRVISGDDLAIFEMASNAGVSQSIDGGSGIDILELQFTFDEWMRDDVQADIAAYLAFLAEHTHKNGQAKGTTFQFSAMALEVRKIEQLRVIVDGEELNPADELVTASDYAQSNSGEHEILIGNVTDNDDVPDLIRMVTLEQGPGKGSLTLDERGNFSYDPGNDFDSLAEGESEQVQFRYRVSDADHDDDTATVTLTITGTNDSPIAHMDSGSTDENLSITVDVLANDTDVDASDTHTVDTATIESGLGSVAIVANRIVWAAGADYDYLALNETATVKIAYVISDNNDAEAGSTLTLSIIGSNDGPIANLDSASTDENASITVDVLANDTDVDTNDSHTVDKATLNAGLGSVAIVNNRIEWSPGLDYDYLATGEEATVEIAYTMSDSHGAEALATLTLTVTGSNDRPVAVADNASTDENASITVDVLANDTDLDASDSHSLDAVTLSAGLGSVAIVDNLVEYNPGTDYDYLALGETATVGVDYSMSDNHGAESVSELALTIQGSNDAPAVAAALASSANEQDAPYEIDLLADASDVDDGAVLNVVGLAEESGQQGWTLNGNILTIDPDYFDDLNFGETGLLGFDLQVQDEHGASVDQRLDVAIEGFTDAPSLNVATSAGANPNEIILTLTVEPADDERVAVEFRDLPPGSTLLTPDRAPQSRTISDFLDGLAIGTRSFLLLLRDETDIDEVANIVATGVLADGGTTESTLKTVDVSVEHSEQVSLLNLGKADQNIWDAGDAYILEFHEYFPMLGTADAPWRSGKVELASVDLKAADLISEVVKFPQQLLDDAKAAFVIASQAVDQAAKAALDAARQALQDAEDFGDQEAAAAFNAAKADIAATLAAARADAESAFDDAQNAFDQAESTGDVQAAADFAAAQQVFTDAANAADAIFAPFRTAYFQAKAEYDRVEALTHSPDVLVAAAAVAELAAVRGPALAATFAAYKGPLAVYNTAISVAQGILDGAQIVYNTAQDAFFDAARATLTLAESTYDASLAAADTVSQDSLAAAQKVFDDANALFISTARDILDDAEIAYDSAQQAIYNAALAVLNGAQGAFDDVGDALNAIDFNARLDIEGEMFGKVGMQVDVVLDAGSVDTAIDYELTVKGTYNHTTDQLRIAPKFVDMGTAEIVPFATVSPNVQFAMKLLYNVGMNVDLFVDGNLAIGDLDIFDLSPDSDGIRTSLTTDSWQDLDHNDPDVPTPGEVSLIDFDSRDPLTLRVPGISDLTRGVFTVDLAIPTIQTEGAAETYSPDFFEEGDLISVDLSEITESFLSLVEARIDFSDKFKTKYGVGSLYDDPELANAVNLIGEAFLKVALDALDGQARGTPIFIMDGHEVSDGALLHVNAVPDDVFGNTLSDETATFGFYAAYGESADIIKVTLDVDQLIAIVIEKVLDAVGTAVTFGALGPLMQVLQEVNIFDLDIGLNGILKFAGVPESTRLEIAQFVDLNLGLETLDIDTNQHANFSQEFSLSVDDMDFAVTMEDGALYTFAANDADNIVIDNASQHDLNGDGSTEYSIQLTPRGMFSNDTELGLGAGIVMDFLKTTFTAGIKVPLNELGLGGLIAGILPAGEPAPTLPTVNINLANVALGPMLRIQSEIDLVSIDLFEKRFDIDLGSDSSAGDFNMIDDEIIGTAGDDVLAGLQGRDFLTGAGGNDLFVFSLGDGHDTIRDFTPGEDALQLLELGLLSFDDVLAAASQVDADTVLTFDSGDSLTLVGVNGSDLHPDSLLV